MMLGRVPDSVVAAGSADGNASKWAQIRAAPRIAEFSMPDFMRAGVWSFGNGMAKALSLGSENMLAGLRMLAILRLDDGRPASGESRMVPARGGSARGQ